MRHDIVRFLSYGEKVELIYMDRDNHISKRLVKLIAIEQNLVRAFCYTRRAPRCFCLDQILAIGFPSRQKKKSTS